MKKYFLYMAAAAFLMVACNKEPLLEDPPEEVPVTGVTLNLPDALLKVGGTLTLEATIEPGDAANKTVTWSSDDDRVATVNSSGEVTAVAPGTAMITATTEDGGFTAYCTVTVEEPPEKPVADIITMTAEVFFQAFYIEVDTGIIVIDWGDGERIEMNNTSSGELGFGHRYSHKSEYNITITGNNIVSLRCIKANLSSNNLMQKNTPFYDSNLTALDVSGCPALKKLFCRDNRISTLDLRSNVLLEYLECTNNRLTTLEVSNNPALKSLECNNNQLTTLAASSSALLEFLSCQTNRLVTLDMSANTALTRLYCTYNQLTSLDVSANTALIILYCGNNQLTSFALNELFRTLHSNTDTFERYVYISNNPGSSDCDVGIAEEKGWYVYR